MGKISIDDTYDQICNTNTMVAMMKSAIIAFFITVIYSPWMNQEDSSVYCAVPRTLIDEASFWPMTAFK